jgi:hypothetical protein
MSEDERQPAANDLAEIDLEVGLILRRLELQILSYLAMNPMLEHPFMDLNGEEIISEIPDHFPTFNEALQQQLIWRFPSFDIQGYLPDAEMIQVLRT